MEIFDIKNLAWLIILGNILMYLSTIVISRLWSKFFNHKEYPLTSKDIRNSIVVLIINILIAIPGYVLLIKGHISFTIAESFFTDLLLLIIIFDFAMYILHFMAHRVWPFSIFHEKHHEHQYFNMISLYVMEPIESILFGALLTVVVYLSTFNIFSFIVFLFFNWILGVIGHLNTNSNIQPKVFGNQVFHKAHHQFSDCNFGFYTVLWDRVFGTYKK